MKINKQFHIYLLKKTASKKLCEQHTKGLISTREFFRLAEQEAFEQGQADADNLVIEEMRLQTI